MVQVNGIVGSDSTWRKTDTVRVIADVTVSNDCCLTVESGTVVLFDAYTRLSVYGSLEASGSPEQRIVFTASSDTAGILLNPGYWHGIHLEN